MVAFGCLLLLPTRCNNAYYTPGLSFVRIVIYIVVEFVEPRGSWLIKQVSFVLCDLKGRRPADCRCVCQYALFSKVEALPLLVLVHLGVRYATRPVQQAVPSQLPVTQADIQDPQLQAASILENLKES